MLSFSPNQPHDGAKGGAFTRHQKGEPEHLGGHPDQRNVAASSSRIPSQISHNGGRSKLMRASITNGVAGGNSEIKRVTRAAGLVIA